MKTIITVTICIGLLTVFGCATTPEGQMAWGNFFQGLSQNLAHQQYYQPETTYIPGQQGLKLESWRYSRPESIFQPRTIVIPGQRQDNSTYWQEKKAKDEYWQRHFGFSIP